MHAVPEGKLKNQHHKCDIRKYHVKICGFITYFVAKKESESCGLTDNTAITLKVKTALVKDKEIWSTNIDIKTIQCKIVVLWGLVGTKTEINKAISHAKSVKGVMQVKSLLKATQM